MTVDHWSDETDWPMVVAGDHEAFGRMFDRHSDLVYRFVLRRTHDRTLAEDAVSYVFLEAWRQRERVLLLDGSLRSWLLGVARNLINRHWRTIERSERATDRLAADQRFASGQPDVGDHLEHDERLAGVLTALAAMPETQRDVLLLSAWEQLGYDEIAAVLHVPVGTVRSRLSRAREHLRQRDRDGTRSSPQTSLVCSSKRSNGGPAALPDERNQP